MKTFCRIFACTILVSCSSGQTPAGILPPDKMEEVLWDQLQADAFTTTFVTKDSTKNLQQVNLELQQKIFQKDHTDKELFYRSYEYYLNHGELMRDLLDSMIAKQSGLREKQRMKEMIKIRKQNEQSQ